MKPGNKLKRLFSMFMALLLVFQNVISYTAHATGEEVPEVHVYVYGDDTADGSESKPVRSLARAYEMLQETGGNILIKCGGSYSTAQYAMKITEDTLLSGTRYKDSTHDITIAEGKKVSIKRHASSVNFEQLINVESGTLTLSDIVIDGTKIGYYSHFLILNNDKVVMEEGTILTNNGDSAVKNLGTFTMNGGEISNNDTYNNGGGVMNGGTGTFIMNGGKIINNTATRDAQGYGSGGAIYNVGTFTMNDGEISGNTAANYGGGVYNSTGEWIMKGGSITHNSSEDGGGISNATERGLKQIMGGTIAHNTATNRGGGIYTTWGATINNATINNNTADGGGGVYVASHDILLENSTVSENTANYGGGIYLNKGGYDDRLEGTINNSEITKNTATVDGGGVYSRDQLTFNSGAISHNTAGNNGGGIFVYFNQTYFSNSKEYLIERLYINGGTISNNTATVDGGGIYNESCLYMTDGTIKNNNAQNGGGIYKHNDLASVKASLEAFTISGGEISNNTASVNGGGIYARHGMILSGGAITGNAATGDGGGIYNYTSSSITGNKALISDNTATNGGGIYNRSTLKLMDGTIKDNKASEAGNGIYQDGTMNMSENASVDLSNDIYVKKTITVPAELNKDTENYGLLTPTEYVVKKQMIRVTYDSGKGSDVLYADESETTKKWNLTEKEGWYLDDSGSYVVLQYEEPAKEYKITFENHDNSVIDERIYPEGDAVAIPTASRESENPKEFYWKFIGWEPEVSEKAVADAVYVAKYEKVFVDYQIIFQDHDGSEISNKTYHYGDEIAVPEAPERASDEPEKYTWIFTGWSPKVADKVTESVTYVAQYEKKYVDYQIIFQDHDGSEISNKTYHYGDEIAVPEAPKRASDEPEKYTWTFTGWNPKVAEKVTESVTYVAQYEKKFMDYEIIFQDHDGSEISKTTYHYGDEITVPKAPERASDKPEEYTWIFTGWSPKVADKVTESVTYVAQYEKKFMDYEIIFQDHDGSVISKKSYNYKMEIEIPKVPQRDSEKPEQYTWVFTGWSPEVSKHAVESVTYVAQYEKKDTMHSIVFQDYDGSEISNQSYKYDEKIVIPDNPTRESEEPEKYTWVFTGWSPELSENAVESVIYVAQYEKQDREYTIVFKDWDGTIISEKKYKYGEKIEIPEDPTREPDTDGTTFRFAEWLPKLKDIAVDNAVYKASFLSFELPKEEEPSEPEIEVPAEPSEDEETTEPETPSEPSEDEVIIKPETPSEEDKAEQDEEKAPAEVQKPEEPKQEKEPVKYTASDNQNGIDNPETGDNSINPYYLWIIFVLSGIGVSYMLFRRKRTN